jgi:glycosyltransferase involved in cell wall biosynthesis
MRPYRLLVVSHVAEIGGAERGIIRKLGSLDRTLFEPSFACPFEGPLTRELAEIGVQVHTGYPSKELLNIRRSSLGDNRLLMLKYPVAFLSSIIRLARLIRSGGYDVVLADSAKADIYATLAGRLARRPVAWHIHDIYKEPTFSRLNLWMLRTLASCFTARIVSVSEAAKEAMVALGVSGQKIQTVYNGIDMELLERTREPSEVRAELGIEPDAPVAGMVGRLVDWKGPDYFIRAAARVAESIPQARFLLVGAATFGEESYLDGLKSLCRELGMEDRVIFTGFRRDVLDLMKAMDVVVHASIEPEPFGQVLLEAMAAGRPTVATTGGGVSEIIDDGVTGLLVPPADAGALAGAIASILKDRGKAVEMGEAGRHKVVESFTVSGMSRGLERELLKALGDER